MERNKDPGPARKCEPGSNKGFCRHRCEYERRALWRHGHRLGRDRVALLGLLPHREVKLRRAQVRQGQARGPLLPPAPSRDLQDPSDRGGTPHSPRALLPLHLNLAWEEECRPRALPVVITRKPPPSRARATGDLAIQCPMDRLLPRTGKRRDCPMTGLAARWGTTSISRSGRRNGILLALPRRPRPSELPLPSLPPPTLPSSVFICAAVCVVGCCLCCWCCWLLFGLLHSSPPASLWLLLLYFLVELLATANQIVRYIYLCSPSAKSAFSLPLHPAFPSLRPFISFSP